MASLISQTLHTKLVHGDNAEDKGDEEPKQSSIELDKTFHHRIGKVSFGDLSEEEINKAYKDGRAFAPLIERWLPKHYLLIHVPGCKGHDFVDKIYQGTKYDEKTFTAGGCIFAPSSMIGKGRKVNIPELQLKASKLIYCIVSNVDFPNIKVKFVRGSVLLRKYPKGNITPKHMDSFFEPW